MYKTLRLSLKKTAQDELLSFYKECIIPLHLLGALEDLQQKPDSAEQLAHLPDVYGFQ